MTALADAAPADAATEREDGMTTEKNNSPDRGLLEMSVDSSCCGDNLMDSSAAHSTMHKRNPPSEL